MRVRAARWFCVLGLLTALGAGQAAKPFFSVSTDRTFAPNDKIRVQVFARGVVRLEFRVYRVKDAMQLFGELEDIHSFGHRPQRERLDGRTRLERYHDWKQAQWRALRNFFRSQFTASARAQIRNRQQAQRDSRAANPAIFASVPLLNSSQLVLRWQQPLSRRYRFTTEQVPIHSLPRGMYIVEATDGQSRAYTLVLVTGLTLVTQTGGGQALIYAADRQTGAPVAGVALGVWTDPGKVKRAKLTTGAEGTAQTGIAAGQYTDLRVVGVHGDDVALVTPWGYNFGNKRAAWRGYVTSDRPVYRPGDAVHFKAILRQMRQGAPVLPELASAQVVVSDETDHAVFQRTLPLSPFGSLSGDLTLPRNGALGYYGITVTLADGTQVANGGFHVEEYHKPEYAVTVTMAKPRVLQGATLHATIGANFYFGEPVAFGRVKYSVHVSPHWSSFPYDDDSEDGGGDAGPEADYAFYQGQQVAEQAGQLDAQGKLAISIPTELAPRGGDIEYRIEARVTDDAGREITGTSAAMATYGSFQIGLIPNSYVVAPGGSVEATAVVANYSGKPVNTKIEARLASQVYGMDRDSEKVYAHYSVVSGPDGRVKVQFAAPPKPPPGASWFVEVVATTPEGRKVTDRVPFWLSDQTADSGNIQLIANQKSYRVGDTAHVLVMTGQPDAYLLVTLGADTLQSARVVHATSPSATLDFPITAAAQPNVMVNVAFVRGGRLYSGTVNLKVPPVQQQLQVSITPTQAVFQPGSPARYRVEVRDQAGRPVRAELSFGVVDEAIYAIEPQGDGSIVGAFYPSRYMALDLGSSFDFNFSGYAGTQSFSITGRSGSPTGRLAQLKPPALKQAKIRKVFPDTAYWAPDVLTDAQGRAEVTLTFPDSLTSWRATVRAVTVNTQVGGARNNVIVRKNVIVRLAAPNFLRYGDEATVGVIAHNYLDATLKAKLNLKASGIEVASGKAATVSVSHRGEAKADWRLRATQVGTATLTATAETTRESDGLQMPLPVEPVGVRRTQAQAGVLDGPSGTQNVTLHLPANPAASGADADFTLAASQAGQVFAALNYLDEFPIENTEDALDTFRADTEIVGALRTLKVRNDVDSPAMEKRIATALQRLLDFQHSDGGWGWWKDDTSLVNMTARVLMALARARAMGWTVPYKPFGPAVLWLWKVVREHPNLRPELRAMILYALTLNHQATPGLLNFADAARPQIAPQGLAWLGLAMQAQGDRRASDIVTQLEGAARVNDREAYWRSNYNYALDFPWDDSPQATALALRLLSEVKPHSPLLPKVAFWLTSHASGGYCWDGGEQTATVLFGLAQYLVAGHELQANFTATVSVNGATVLSHHFTPAEAMGLTSPSLHLEASALRAGENAVAIRMNGTGRLYWTVNSEYFSSEKSLVQRNQLELNLTRDYFRIVPVRKFGVIKYRLEPLSSAALKVLRPGDILAVRDTLSGNTWRYLSLEDPIPAGAEYVAHPETYRLEEPPTWWMWTWGSIENRDDRLMYFQPYFEGKAQFVYLLRMTTPGQFHVSPASVRPLYQSGLLATSDAVTVEVKR